MKALSIAVFFFASVPLAYYSLAQNTLLKGNCPPYPSGMECLLTDLDGKNAECLACAPVPPSCQRPPHKMPACKCYKTLEEIQLGPVDPKTCK